MLLCRKKIIADMVFILNPQEQGETHRRSLSEILMLDEVLTMPKGSKRVTWPGEDAAYGWLKAFVQYLERDFSIEEQL
jgi:hypothetical protein